MHFSAWMWIKRLAPFVWVAIAAVAGYVLWTRLESFTFAAMTAALSDVSLQATIAAFMSCSLAYVILSAYEVIAVHAVTNRWLVHTASITSWIAHSIGHVIGAALVSGGALRYRSYAASGLSAKDVGAITAQGALPYILGAGWILDIALLLFPADAARALQIPTQYVLCLGVVGLIKDIAWIALVSYKRTLQLGSWSLPLPSLTLTLIQIVVGILEILLVASILYWFMPADLEMTLIAFTGIFLIAASAAQLSHVPAGLGVLEAALLLLLPQVPPSQVLAAVLCYRAIFELFPLAVGVALLVYAELNQAKRHETVVFNQDAG